MRQLCRHLTQKLHITKLEGYICFFTIHFIQGADCLTFLKKSEGFCLFLTYPMVNNTCFPYALGLVFALIPSVFLNLCST